MELDDVMIQELLEKHKDNMCKESHSYRLRRIAYLELIEIFKQEEMISGPFQRYLILLEEDRIALYQRHYNWGFTLGCGKGIEITDTHEAAPKTEGLQEAKEGMEDTARWFNEEIFALWKLFCRLERKCRIYEAAYLTALGVEDGELHQQKNGILPQ